MTREHMPTNDRLKELLMGKSIIKAEKVEEGRIPGTYDQGPLGVLTLSDGTTLYVWGNEGCACSAGCYPLTHLAACENIITNVEVEENPHGDGYLCSECGKTYCYEHEQGYFRLFVFAGHEKINVASFEGSDGNGYYGTGWWLRVHSTEGDN